MQDEAAFERAKEIAQATLTRMIGMGVTTNADNFTVWYSYLSGDYPDLTRNIDAKLRDKTAFTDAVMEELHAEFFGIDRAEASLREASTKISEMVRDVLDRLSEAGQGTSQYSETLNEFRKKLAVSDGTDLVDLVDEITDETRIMAHRSKLIEQKIADSSQQITAVEEKFEATQKASACDDLTGLANWKTFHSALRQAALEASKEGQPLSLVAIDIDNFDGFTDRYGRAIGDQLLKLVAGVLKKVLTEEDTAARTGAGDFVVIMPKTTRERARTRSDGIRERMASQALVNKSNGQKLGLVTVSIGVSQYITGEALGDIIQRANAALEHAKAEGANCVVTDDVLEDDAAA